ncbi:MAG: hypothetical protein JO032_14455 [Alphaproteobacteria bacterium]|nr:hypothetical protein [Alphaproteobacteria bacterium]
MDRIMAAAFAAAVFITMTGGADAANVCQWTGADWACGDGNIVTAHYPQAQGPNIAVTPAAAPQLPDGQALPNVYGAPTR